MTRFWRDGFWRTSMYGNTHWVDGHWVDRDDWERYSADSPSFSPSDFLGFYRANRGSTARFVNPNADCPVCGQPVFYYQNENGSRVFFDELGPPWPKHPCTDNPSFSEAPQGESVIHPVARESSQRHCKLPRACGARFGSGIQRSLQHAPMEHV
jgi:hypothetical protein